MKPVSYSGKRHSNMTEVVKWANSGPGGTARRRTRRSHPTVLAVKRVTKKRSREISKRMIREVF
jgi:hypothetical protein